MRKMVMCAARGKESPCVGGPPSRRCGLCGAVAYCSLSHQTLHWKDHKKECEIFQQQMRRADVLDDYPFLFFKDIINSENSCSFLVSRGIHKIGLWKYVCCCQSVVSSDISCMDDDWKLPNIDCPCTVSRNPLSKPLDCWKDYYEWRHISLDSADALLLHWPLTIYNCFQLVSNQVLDVHDRLTIHYLGPERELLQLAIFRELCALFPGVDLHIDFFGPAVPQSRDGREVNLSIWHESTDMGNTCQFARKDDSFENHKDSTVSVLTLMFYSGFYHEIYGHRKKVSPPHIIVAPNAGIAAYLSWLPTIELIKEMGVPAIFTDFCEEAANLSGKCIQTVTGQPLRVPVQVNAFRQPMPVEESPFYLPCYSNAFIFGM